MSWVYTTKNNRLKQIDTLNSSKLAWDSGPSDRNVLLASAIGLVGVGALFSTGNIIEAGLLLFILSLFYNAKFKFNRAMVDQPTVEIEHSNKLILYYAALLKTPSAGSNRFEPLKTKLTDDLGSDLLTNDELTRIVGLIKTQYAVECIAERDLAEIVPGQADSAKPSAPPLDSQQQGESGLGSSPYSSLWRQQKTTYLMGPDAFESAIKPTLQLLANALDTAIVLEKPPELVSKLALRNS